ncbi:HAD family acid phosphatase [Amycolatopsis sp. H20-H5]|uniref:HAD family acid phosphatase n=1 Tax=Amycolatopsis sp. H20-H5 TaxID=3046309 RepID=UPI002DB6ED1A|nr:HAD family acid phosphatase [Amycolatopsis sp. H20-H5]MEC3980355.1 HAD family acid phosphatase [Amycolatopsis sp. H20-H5]
MSGLFKLAAAVAIGATVAGGATALATQDGAASKSREPANIGQVKNDVKAYYGDYLDASGKHHYSDTSTFVKDSQKQVADAKRYLSKRLTDQVKNPAIVLDVDDTSEITFGWEADNDFGFDPVKQQAAIDKGEFPANKPVLELANWAAQHGVKVYFLTGRNELQGPQSLKNLANEGYPAPAGAFFKPKTTAPDYLPCGLTCNTVQYKSGTRAHIAKTATIVLNLGDQFSDLEGGYAERPVKLPNPMYYLP